MFYPGHFRKSKPGASGTESRLPYVSKSQLYKAQIAIINYEQCQPFPWVSLLSPDKNSKVGKKVPLS